MLNYLSISGIRWASGTEKVKSWWGDGAKPGADWTRLVDSGKEEEEIIVLVDLNSDLTTWRRLGLRDVSGGWQESALLTINVSHY